MKLTDEDKALLLELGETEDNFRQVEEAMKTCYTKYSCDVKTISRQKAIELLGRRKYICGLTRSAFHWTAVQETSDGKTVHFDSRRLFR